MNLRLVCSLLGVVAWLIGATMVFSVIWAFPLFHGGTGLERAGLLGLIASMIVCGAVGAILWWTGRGHHGTLYRKEAMAIVGLSWVLATVLGALPFWLSGTGLSHSPDDPAVPIPMTLIDCLFESQSGFSTTGATVLTDVEDPRLVPRCILFWRSSTHFLGGLGIIVLFVAVLGHGSAGKALMRAEMPGPSKEGSAPRMQHTAWIFATIYVALNFVLTVILWLEGMSVFDALCHAFGTMATGGFSTRNASIGYFDSAAIDYTITLFMILAGTNFTLLYLTFIGNAARLWADVEWRAYLGAILGVTAMLIVVGIFWYDDFAVPGHEGIGDEARDACRYGLFQVVSVITTTGYGTHDFDRWNHFARAVLFLLMFVGGCAGSTGGGLKVIRHVLFLKIIWLEVERAFRPSVVRYLRLGGEPVTDPELPRQILLYFALILFIFMASWITLVAVQQDAMWTDRSMSLDNKLIDCASAVAATLNNIGPGLGTVGSTQNYSAFDGEAKLLFVFLMMLGRLELFSILVLLVPSFWRNH